MDAEVTEDMGPFKVALGTQYDDGRGWKHEMVPDKSLWRRFQERATRKYRTAATYLADPQ